MTNSNDGFIDEVTEAVRRERLASWARRWGWLVLLILVLIVAFAGWTEWREAQARAAAELRGEALLGALERPGAEDRLAALSELPRDGEAGMIAAFLLAAEQETQGDGATAAATLDAVAAGGDVPPLYRDLAALKAQMARGADADPAAIDALAAPGAPFRLLALEQLAQVHVSNGRTAEALERLGSILEDAGVAPGQRDRVTALMTALGAPPDASAPDVPAVAPGGE